MLQWFIFLKKIQHIYEYMCISLGSMKWECLCIALHCQQLVPAIPHPECAGGHPLPWVAAVPNVSLLPGGRETGVEVPTWSRERGTPAHVHSLFHNCRGQSPVGIVTFEQNNYHVHIITSQRCPYVHNIWLKIYHLGPFDIHNWHSVFAVEYNTIL